MFETIWDVLKILLALVILTSPISLPLLIAFGGGTLMTLLNSARVIYRVVKSGVV